MTAAVSRGDAGSQETVSSKFTDFGTTGLELVGVQEAERPGERPNDDGRVAWELPSHAVGTMLLCLECLEDDQKEGNMSRINSIA